MESDTMAIGNWQICPEDMKRLNGFFQKDGMPSAYKLGFFSKLLLSNGSSKKLYKIHLSFFVLRSSFRLPILFPVFFRGFILGIYSYL
jgi:hypothetical protein